MPMKGIDQKKIDQHDRLNWSADQCCLAFWSTVVIDVLMTDQLKFFIVFYNILYPFVATYNMVPRPSDEGQQIGGLFSLLWSARGMGP